MGALTGDRFVEVEVAGADQLWKWLREHHAQADGVWLVTYKKVVPERYVTHDDVLDALIAFGWCDGIRRRIDDRRSMQLISPRRTQPWAKSYKDRADRLTARGLMQPGGRAAVERAKADGMWEAMNDVDALLVPDDLAAALRCRPDASRHFAAFPPSTRRNMLRWIASARTASTRTRRLSIIADDARRDIRTKTNG